MIKNIQKLKFNSDDDLPLTKTLEFNNMMIVVRSTFYEDNKYYPQVFFLMNVCINYKCSNIIGLTFTKPVVCLNLYFAITGTYLG